MTTPALSPRALATSVIRRVLLDDAFAAAALTAELDRHVQLSSRDRAAVTDLVYGALRAARYLDGRLSRLRPGLSLDPPLRALFWVAGYELTFRPMAPPPVVVSDAVEICKSIQRSASGLVNALLRRLLDDLTTSPAPPLPEAFVTGTPRWLRRALDRSLGSGEAERFLAAGPLPPPLCLRVRQGKRASWMERLQAENPSATFKESPLVSSAIRCFGGGDPRRWSGVREGALVLQEEGSQLIGQCLEVRPGEIILDACAGRGNKTFLIADALGGSGRVDAADLHGTKLERLRTEAERLGIKLGDTFEIDASVGRGAIRTAAYDRLLIDAPCSGVGTLRRRPEILLRRTESSLGELQTLQRTIVRNLAPAVKPGGTLLYAVCSVLREECEEVIENLEGFALEELWRLLPHREGCDGYAIARLRAL
ncbi:MAG: transcription antitermination factor NusB [Myxococcales bacterium]|nr:Sun protein [Polyangiaceae bacterium]MDW8249768.1 transcription antitermination factor NusB [Myxococcales bacterium]